MKRTIKEQDKHLKQIKEHIDPELIAVIFASALTGISIFIILTILILITL